MFQLVAWYFYFFNGYFFNGISRDWGVFPYDFNDSVLIRVSLDLGPTILVLWYRLNRLVA